MLRPRPLLAALVAALALAPDAGAQDLEALRELLRDQLESSHFAGGLLTLVMFSNEFAVTGAQYSIEDGYATELRTLILPWHTTLRPGGADAPGLYLEGVAGRITAWQHVDDVWAGDLPGAETEVGTRWRSDSVLAGVGVELPLGEELTLTPIVHLGISHYENDTQYLGPGAATTAALLDGLAFNWDGYAWTRGLAARVDWGRPVGDALELDVVGRYDLRWADSFHESDRAQAFSVRGQTASLHGELSGPTGLRVLDGALGWRATLAERSQLEDDLFGNRHLVMIGGALELDGTGAWSVPGTAVLSGAWITGPDLEGWSLGLSWSF
ncbi:MAG: hypothetical protein H6828_07355 [Planctomycetes bacterium]|nr:hypothetical protein [Planctomycetota bacterium]